MNIRRTIVFFVTIVSLLSVTHGNAKTFKISTTAPNGSYWMNQMKQGAKEIKKETSGRVKFKFYPGGVMGSEEVVMKKIRIRQLHGAAVSSGVLEKFYPDSQIYGLPMLFNNYKEVDVVRTEFDEVIIKGLEEAGMISFGLSEGGFAYAMSTKPISKTEDLTKHKVWTPVNNQQAEMTLKSFGINPIPLTIGDVLTGLQTNIIDTVAVSPIAAIALQWHTQVKYMTNIPLSYIYATMLVKKEEFEKISPDDQKIVRKIMNKVFARIDKQNRKDNKAAFEALLNQGIELIKPLGDSIMDWRKKGELARLDIESNGKLSDRAIVKLKKLLDSARKKDELLGASR